MKGAEYYLLKAAYHEIVMAKEYLWKAETALRVIGENTQGHMRNMLDKTADKIVAIVKEIEWAEKMIHRMTLEQFLLDLEEEGEDNA